MSIVLDPIRREASTTLDEYGVDEPFGNLNDLQTPADALHAQGLPAA